MKLDPNSGSSGVFGYNIEGMAPQGQVIAVCLDIRDQFGVDRKKFQSEEMEKQDVTRFLFGFIGQDQRPYLVQTFEFKISGNSGSNLVEFLKAWTNRDPYGFDYLELKGTGAMITVGAKQSSRTPGKWYNTIGAVSPVYPTLQAQIPHPQTFAALLTKALTQPDPQQNKPPGGAPPTGPAHGFAPPPGPPPVPPGYGAPPAPPAPPQGDQILWCMQNGVTIQLPRATVQQGIQIGSVTHVLNPQTQQWQEVKPAVPAMPTPPQYAQPPAPPAPPVAPPAAPTPPGYPGFPSQPMPPPPAANPGWGAPPPAAPPAAPPPVAPPLGQPQDDIPF